jgi:cell pole-organizing protein PopZ
MKANGAPDPEEIRAAAAGYADPAHMPAPLKDEPASTAQPSIAELAARVEHDRRELAAVAAELAAKADVKARLSAKMRTVSRVDLALAAVAIAGIVVAAVFWRRHRAAA